MSLPSASDSAAPSKQLEELQERDARYRLKVAQDFLVLQTQLEAHRQRIEELIAEVRRQTGTISELRAAQDHERRQAQAILSDLEHFAHARARVEDERDALQRRIAELRRSLSWRITAPVRAIQRRLARSESRSTAPSEIAAGPSPFIYFLHTSLFRRFRGAKAVLHGWVSCRDGRAITGVRARVGSRTLTGQHGLPEPGHPSPVGEPAAHGPGFEVVIETPVGRHQLVIEAEVEAKEWQLVVQTPIWCEDSTG